MKLGLDDKKKRIQAAVAVPLALIALIYLYVEVFGGSSASPSPAVAPAAVSTTAAAGGRAASGRNTGSAAKQVTTTSAQLDPTLHPEVMAAAESLVYTGSGRNIFSSSAAPVAIETPIASARPKTSGPAVAAVYVPPPPPPIDLKFFGTETSANGDKKAFLLHGEDVFIASAGDVVDRRYRVIRILPNGIEVEDIPNSNKQTLPLLLN